MKRGLVLSAVLAVAASACTPSIPDCALRLPNPALPQFLLVEYAPDTPADAPANIQRTPTYERLRPTVRSVAVRVNDDCFEAEFATAARFPAQRSLVLKSVCARWVVEIERALSAAGLAVFSWNTVIQVEQAKGLTTFDAAKELGADVVFLFDHLDAFDIRRYSPTREHLRFFTADEHGHAFGPRRVNDLTTAGIGAFVDEIVGERFDTRTVLAGSAVQPSTGEAIWYYERTQTAPLGRVNGLRFLFGRYGDASWNPIRPEPSPGEISWTAGLIDIRINRAGTDVGNRELRDAMIRDGATAFVQAFEGEK